MKRLTTRIERDNLSDVDDLVERGVYPNRSEAIRAALRDLVRSHRVHQDRLVPDGGQTLETDPSDVDWLGCDPDECARLLNRSLEEVLRVVVEADVLLDAHLRLGSSNISTTKGALEDLGFYDARQHELVDAETREKRAGLIRRWYA